MARLAVLRVKRGVVLPAAAGGEATATGTRAGAGHRAVGRLRDGELVVRLRGRHDRVAVAGPVRGCLHLAGAGAKREASGAAGTAGVGVGVRVAGLHLADHVASVGLGARVLGLRALAEEVRQSDRGQDANDQDDDEELDQSETALLGLNTRAELPQHACDLLREDLGSWSQATQASPFD